MLFNSPEFLFGFLPIVLFGFFLLNRSSRRWAILWLALASIFFYGWWDWRFLGVLLASMAGNFAAGRALGRGQGGRPFLACAVAGNLAVLGGFKYAGFAVANWNLASGMALPLPGVVLPIGISFFTFQQIAYLVDAFRGEAREYDFAQYCLFVTFFPQLIAGPIVHHKEMLPQFARKARRRFRASDLAVGGTIFALGLFKKVILADSLALYASPVFQAARTGGALTLAEAWTGALSYTLQIYFDFSGYSDMAIGGARLFGIRLPVNFASPYKAASMVDFWRRWHMTLSRFLRDYLYLPLGGNRLGTTRRYLNLLLVMILGGLWHGANWTFVAWGLLHGLYLCLNHAWRAGKRILGWKRRGGPVARAIAWMTTFLAVVVAWVLFRAETMGEALAMLRAMTGFDGLSLPASLVGRLGQLEPWLVAHGLSFTGLFPNVRGFWPAAPLAVALGLLIALGLPNTQELMRRYRPTLEPAGKARIAWRATPAWGTVTAVVAVVALLGLSRVSEFLYFQF
ncbi:MAG: MBOAT family protein [Alphaproteobacteria bacterium]|nr:MBOAT family protein [Alphaproteobacteria bacterium]